MNKKEKTIKSRSDVAVQGTNDSSIISKWSMSNLGYFSDDFVQFFIAKCCRRSPLINRGYYIRSVAVTHAIMTFLKSAGDSQRTQVVSLGAGFDSAYFRLKAENQLELTTYVEVDFRELLMTKVKMIQSQERLRELAGPSIPLSPTDSNIVLNTGNLKLIGCDLTKVDLLTKSLAAAGVDFSLPTLVLSEVVITYLVPDRSSDVIRWAGQTFYNAVFISYEQVKPYDAFGTFMCNHFRKLGSPLRSIDAFPTIRSQVERYCHLGWSDCAAGDLNYFYENIVTFSERHRVEVIEPFDEFEEWHLKCSHYVLLTAFNGDSRRLLQPMWAFSEPEIDAQISDKNCAASVEASDAVQTLELEHFGELVVARSGRSAVDMLYRGREKRLRCFEKLELRETSNDECRDTSSNGEWCRRFGHAVCAFVIDGRRLLLTVGGFGLRDRKHRRLCEVDVRLFDDGGSTAEVRHTVTGNPALLERLFHTATAVTDERIVIFGGRTSPAKRPTETCVMECYVETQSDGMVVDLRVTALDLDEPCHRWRHSATQMCINGVASLVVFGGRSFGTRCLADCWILDCSTWTWRKAETTGSIPTARHSHTADAWADKVVVACGLGLDLRPLNSIHILSTTSMEWCLLDVVDELMPRYSHSSAVHADHLVLVGGVSLSGHSPGVATICLRTGSLRQFDLQMPRPVRPIMLHSHASVRASCDGEGTAKLVIVGGGGNCFSFGTHLNETTLTLEVPL